MKKNIINLILVITWMLFIFIMSSYNSTESTNQSNYIVNIIANIFNIKSLSILSIIIRKLAHFTEYLILGILVYNLIKSYHKPVFISIIICCIYSISDELHQLFIPGRTCQIIDILIDTLGSLTAIFIIKKIKTK